MTLKQTYEFIDLNLALVQKKTYIENLDFAFEIYSPLLYVLSATVI